MNAYLISDLIKNAALLLALSILYDFISTNRKAPLRDVFTGFILGAICLGVMLNTFNLTPGVVYDTRSILLGISGLFFDPISTAIAALMASIYRFYLGGMGAIAGVATIFATALIGVIWRRKNINRLDYISTGELYIFGIVVHFGMLSCQLLIPWPKSIESLKNVFIPVMLIYPVGTMLLGKLMIDRNLKIKTKAELAKNRAMLEEILNSIPFSVFWKDRDSVYQGCNMQFAKDIGISSPGEIAGKTDYDMPWPKSDADGYIHDDKEVLNSKLPKRNIVEQLTKHDGKRIWLSTTKVPLIDSGNEVFGVLGLYEDITERRLAEMELMKAKHAAEEASHAKSMFLANMSHEIRTPMNGIVGFAKLLEMSDLDDTQKDYVSVINSSSRHLLDIINDILDISRIEAGKVKLESRPFDLFSVLSQTMETFKPAIENKGLKYKIEISPEIDYLVYGDSTRISQLLFNLINNSVKFTERGCIEASITQLGRDSSSATLRFSIADTGIGIEKEKLTKIFDSFFQIDGSYTKKYQGTGLGLAIVKNLTNLMGGDVSVQSSAGKGTRFDIDIAFKIEAKTYKAAEKSSEGVLPPSMAGAGMSALIVEDDQISAKLAMLMAQKQGFKTSHASNGVKAIEMIEREKFDLVLMDIQLPEMDGMTAIKLIKRRCSEGIENYCVMIIALTAYALSGDREKFMEAGADEYIAKPFNEIDFAEKICSVLKKRSDNKRLLSKSKG